MKTYEILVHVGNADDGNGQVRLVIQATNYASAEAFAYQMNQGYVTVYEIEE